MDGYRISLGVAVAFIVVIGTIIGLPTAKLFVGLPDYGINVEPVMDDLNDKQLEIEHLIIAAIDNIDKINENIEVQNGMSSRDVDRYEKWKRENISSQIFEYDGNYFRIGSGYPENE